MPLPTTTTMMATTMVDTTAIAVAIMVEITGIAAATTVAVEATATERQLDLIVSRERDTYTHRFLRLRREATVRRHETLAAFRKR